MRRAACLFLSVSSVAFLMAEALPARASTCSIPAALLFTYPSAELSRLPQNAVPFVVTDGLARVDGIYIAGLYVRGNEAEPYFFDPGEELTPGTQALEIEAAPRAHTVVSRSALRLALEFEVEPRLAPPPDEIASARITRAVIFEPGPERTLRREGYLLEHSRRLEEPLDCSRIIADQTQDYCGITSRPYPGDLRLEIEAEGDPLGFTINGLFMPGHCRSTFFPADVDTLEIRAVTATGLGSAEPFSGEIESYVAPPAPSPPSPITSDSPSHVVCALSPHSQATSRLADLGLILLAGATILFRLRRR